MCLKGDPYFLALGLTGLISLQSKGLSRVSHITIQKHQFFNAQPSLWTNSQSSLKLTSIESVMPSSHLILCHPLFLLPPIPPSIRVFSNESTLCMRWPKYWSFIMLKILQARLQQCMNRELPDVQAGFRKGRGTRDQIANICWIIKSKRVPEKHLFLLYLLCQSL